MADLTDLPNVELMRTGTYRLKSGETTFTPDDLQAAVEAQACPAIRRPVLKLGHDDPRFDGQPAVGWIGDMVTAADGESLTGSYRGMPTQLGEILPSAYPNRSIEGVRDHVCALGHSHPFVVTAVALLGTTPPGISTLQDIHSLYGLAAAAPVDAITFTVPFKAPEPNPVIKAAASDPRLMVLWGVRTRRIQADNADQTLKWLQDGVLTWPDIRDSVPAEAYRLLASVPDAEEGPSGEELYYRLYPEERPTR